MWSSDQAKLTSLVENAEEFAAFYVEFAKKVSSAALEEREDGMDVDDGDDDGEEVEVVRGVNVGRMLKDRQGENVARGVIRYLEGLRDGIGS